MKYVVDEKLFSRLSPEDQALLEDEAEMIGGPEGGEDMPDEEKNKIKDFDEASDKGMALMVGIGKPKGKMPPKKEMQEE